MRVPRHHLFADMTNHIVDIKLTHLLRQLAVKDNLEEQITEFLTNLFRVIFIQSIKEFIGLLNKERLEAFPGLLPVPGTAVTAPQPFHNFNQLLKGHKQKYIKSAESR